MEEYLKESEHINESEKQDEDINSTKELWEECDNQEFSEEQDLTENVCIIMFTFQINNMHLFSITNVAVAEKNLTRIYIRMNQ